MSEPIDTKQLAMAIASKRFDYPHAAIHDDVRWLDRIAKELIAEVERLREENEKLKDEKRRRVYYQDIVYGTCAQLDAEFGLSMAKGDGIVCGTADEPTEEVIDRIKQLRRRAKAVRLGANS